ncbi:MAG: RNA 2',3'-cyclic phosphodiesterase [Methylobacter sp.]|nr:MAG: RNA 2',3'-cyclic phosphodiesterase [Methylobacter sp.]
MAMPRLFFALWPDENTRQALTTLSELLVKKGVKPVTPENLHVTLAFLGQVNAEQAQFLLEHANGVHCKPVQLCFDQLSYWKKPRVLCLSARETPVALAELARDLSGLGLACGLEMDGRPYVPHVTLAKKVSKALVLEFEPIDWLANAFVLAESVSQPGGVRYEPVKRWSFTCARTQVQTE